jgi:hypothetical protein
MEDYSLGLVNSEILVSLHTSRSTRIILHTKLEYFHLFLPSFSSFSICWRVRLSTYLSAYLSIRLLPIYLSVFISSSCLSVIQLPACLSFLSLFPRSSYFPVVMRNTWIDRLDHVRRIAFQRVVYIVTQQCTLLPIVRTAPLVLRATWSWGDLFVYIVLLTCGLPAATWRSSALHTVSDVHIFIRNGSIFIYPFIARMYAAGTASFNKIHTHRQEISWCSDGAVDLFARYFAYRTGYKQLSGFSLLLSLLIS